MKLKDSNIHTKIYDVFGIGNALLDLEYRVEQAFLIKNNIAKGRMSLVNFNQQQKLRDKLSKSSPNQMHPGGSAANTLFLMSNLGSKTHYHANLGNDVMGKHYFHCLNHTGLSTNITENTLTPGNTGVCLVMITPDAERTMLTNLGVSNQFHKDHIDIEKIQKAKYVYIEGYIITCDNSYEIIGNIINTARASQTKISITLSDAILVDNFHDTFHKIINKENPIDLLFCNKHEAFAFAKTNDLSQVKEYLKNYSKQFVITLGKEGSCIYDGEKFHHINGKKVNAINTLGAGDMYAGAYLHAITQGLSAQDAAAFANEASSKIVTKSGPRLSTQEAHKLRELLPNYKDNTIIA
jgi:sugar/nucleoside kinase (ribokinase family)